MTVCTPDPGVGRGKCFVLALGRVFSFYPREVLRSVPLNLPNGISQHSPIYRRLKCWALGAHDSCALTRHYSVTAPCL